MTIPIERVVDVSITRESVFPSAPGFGTLLIVAPSSTGVISLGDRVRSYSSVAEVLADGFVATSEEYKAAAAAFAQNPSLSQILIGVRDTGEADIATEMAAIQAVNDDWYGVMLTAEGRPSVSTTPLIQLAAWVETQKKVAVVASNEAAILTVSGGVAGTLSAAGYDRTAVFYHHLATTGAGNSYPEAAFFSRMFTTNFDGVDTTKTGDFQKLSGIETSPVTSAQLSFLQTNNAMGYIQVANTPMVFNSRMASSEWFDIMHGTDWLTAEIAFGVFGHLAVTGRVPFTDAGMESLVDKVRRALQQAVTNGLLASRLVDGTLEPAFTVSAPLVSTVSEADRSNRIGAPITFTGLYASAIHKGSVSGTISI